ncbi:hypothetical protein AAES_121169 [Amazona aestiva]|uniref:Uncharacterized protein n=1 Tax=Amazona aestiva TaxID=12930 RepID=A0A0Q3PPE5_AMAAE|nr:hypothetical protein AAES_121169 [Amazona aestiva]
MLCNEASPPELLTLAKEEYAFCVETSDFSYFLLGLLFMPQILEEELQRCPSGVLDHHNRPSHMEMRCWDLSYDKIQTSIETQELKIGSSSLPGDGSSNDKCIWVIWDHSS